MRTNKYLYFKVIQSNHGYGWDDETAHETDSHGVVKDLEAMKSDLKAYRENCAAPIRVIKRREVNNG